MYSAAISSSSSVADRPRFRSTGLPGAADLAEQREVLHVARAELDHVGHLEHRLEVAHVHQLGHDRQARSRPWPRPAGAGPACRGPGRSTATCAACRRRRGGTAAPASLTARAVSSSLLARLHRAGAGDHANGRPRSWPAIVEHGARLALELERRELVRLEDRDDLVDARHALEPEVRDVLPVADRADHGDDSPREMCAFAPTCSTRSRRRRSPPASRPSFITIIICPYSLSNW